MSDPIRDAVERTKQEIRNALICDQTTGAGDYNEAVEYADRIVGKAAEAHPQDSEDKSGTGLLLDALAIHSTTPQGLPGAAHEEGGGWRERIDSLKAVEIFAHRPSTTWESLYDYLAKRIEEYAALASQEPPAAESDAVREFLAEVRPMTPEEFESLGKFYKKVYKPAGAASEAVGRALGALWNHVREEHYNRTGNLPSNETLNADVRFFLTHDFCYTLKDYDKMDADLAALERATGAAPSKQSGGSNDS